VLPGPFRAASFPWHFCLSFCLILFCHFHVGRAYFPK
jgi:hypothetical protein